MTIHEKLILLGGGGHCLASLAVIEAEGKFEIEGILDGNIENGTRVGNTKIIGSDQDISTWVDKNATFLITVGHIKDPAPRMRIYERIRRSGGKMATVVSPRAIVASDATLGEGTIVMHGVVVNPGVAVGVNCILNSLCLIEHNCIVGNHSHVSTGALVNGGVVIGECCFIGSGAIIKNGLKIGKNSVIPFGTPVAHSISEPTD